MKLKLNEANHCSRCNKIPILTYVNSANKKDVARMWDYTLSCECGRTVTATTIQDLVNIWNSKYGTKPSSNKQNFVSDISSEYFGSEEE